LIMEPIICDPWHSAIWLTGATLWTVVFIAMGWLVAGVIWRAIFATAVVARAFYRIYAQGRKRNPDCTVAEAWLHAFWYGKLPG
jgi:hypothetical protein